MKELNDFIKISKYAGERFDLVQAGGGNCSVKLDNGDMVIKSSGYLLSDIQINNGYSKVNNKKIIDIIKSEQIINEKNKKKRENISSNLLQDAILDKINRPSIETLMHSLLHKFTLHTHPLVVNMLVIQKEYKEILMSIFQGHQIAIVPYKTPGVELALELDKTLKDFETIPKIIFLQNHGLIITSPYNQEIKKITEMVLDKIEKYLRINMSRYKYTNKISSLLNKVEKNSKISFLSEDSFLNEQIKHNKELFLQKPFCPDGLVFCGVTSVIIKNLYDSLPIEHYKKRYFELPKVVILGNRIFFIASNIKKAKEIEEVMKFNIMVLEKNMKSNKNFLEEDELAYLNNWEAEKYRQKI